MHHRARELILTVGQQVVFQPLHAAQLVFVEQHAGGINRILADFVAPQANGIEVLKRNPPRIDLRVARDAGGIVAVIFHALLECELEDFRVGQINLRHGRRRWWRWIVQQIFQQPNATLKWVRILAVRVHCQ